MSSYWHLPPLHALGLAPLSTRQAPWGVTFCTSASVSFCQDGQAEASLWREVTLLGSDWEQKQQLFMCKMPHMCQAALCLQPLYSTLSWRPGGQKMFCRFFHPKCSLCQEYYTHQNKPILLAQFMIHIKGFYSIVSLQSPAQNPASPQLFVWTEIRFEKSRTNEMGQNRKNS